MTKLASHIPARNTKQYLLLKRLLAGERVDPFTSLMELNLPTLNARVSELRRMGWPIRDKKEVHPKLKDEKIVVFYMDLHFRQWVASNPDKPPEEYPGQEGRGKFAREDGSTPKAA